MKLKVCGMKYPENIKAVSALKPDFLGFIFYEKSARFFEGKAIEISPGIQKVGVFVNESPKKITQKIQEFQLDVVQLHGDETPEDCENIKNLNPQIKIWKAFALSEEFDFGKVEDYEVTDAFLLDTKGKNYGGNGVKFNWEILKNYNSEKGIVLSGGISQEDISLIYELQKEIPKIQTVDINSRFEIQPGLKDVELVNKFYQELKRQQ